jgi:hypothetical protein
MKTMLQPPAEILRAYLIVATTVPDQPSEFSVQRLERSQITAEMLRSLEGLPSYDEIAEGSVS